MGQRSALISLGEANAAVVESDAVLMALTTSSDSHMDVLSPGWPSMQTRVVSLPRKAAELPICGEVKHIPFAAESSYIFPLWKLILREKDQAFFGQC